MSDEIGGRKHSLELNVSDHAVFIDESSAEMEQSVIIHSQHGTLELSNKALQFINKSKTQPLDSVSPPPTNMPTTKMRISHSHDPHNRRHSNRISHQPSSSLLNHKKYHQRQVSVGNLVPHSFAERAVSIIRLIDQQTNIHSLQNYSFSAKNEGNKTPSFATADDDYDYFAPQKDIDTILEDVEIKNTINFSNSASRRSIDTSKPTFNAVEELLQDTMDFNDDQSTDGMNMLAKNAAEEFLNLAAENEQLFHDRERFRLKLEDMEHTVELLNSDIQEKEIHVRNHSILLTELDRLRAQVMVLETEQQILQANVEEDMQAAANANEMSSTTPSMGIDVYVNNYSNKKLDRKQRTSESTHNFLMQSIQKLQSEKLEIAELYQQSIEDKNIIKLKFQSNKRLLHETENERLELSSRLDKQQSNYVTLKYSKEKKIQKLENQLVTKRDSLIVEDLRDNEILQTVVDQQQEIIKLRHENEQLMSEMHIDKINADDEMFDIFRKQLHNQRSERGDQRSIQFQINYDLASELGGMHSRNDTFSYSMTGDYFALGSGAQSEIFNNLKSVRTAVNIFDPTEMSYISKNRLSQELIVDKIEEKVEEDDEQKVEGGESPEEIAKKAKEKRDAIVEKLRKKKLQHIQKRNAEIEFFILTCIAVKQNLQEEYMERGVDMLGENAYKLFEIAQKQGIEMYKFHLWIDNHLRSKYNLPKSTGFSKFKKRVNKTAQMIKAKSGQKAEEIKRKFTATSVADAFKRKVTPKVQIAGPDIIIPRISGFSVSETIPVPNDCNLKVGKVQSISHSNEVSSDRTDTKEIIVENVENEKTEPPVNENSCGCVIQ